MEPTRGPRLASTGLMKAVIRSTARILLTIAAFLLIYACFEWSVVHNVLFSFPADIAARSPDPAYRFGLIADIQYSDADDEYDFSGTRRRYFRRGLAHLRRAVDHWRAERVDGVIQLGDLLDGSQTRRKRLGRAAEEVSKVIAGLRGVPWHHCVGNHERYAFEERKLRERIKASAGVDSAGRNYYSFSPSPGFVIVMLHSYEVSVINVEEGGEAGEEIGDPPHLSRVNVKEGGKAKEKIDDPPQLSRVAEARRLLDRHNPNENKRSAEGLTGLNRRWVALNGALGNDQLAWLNRTLGRAKSRAEKVMVVSHVPLHPHAVVDYVNLAWDYDEAMEVIRGVGRGVVVAALAGHDHDGATFFSKEDDDIPFLTLNAVLEADPTTTPFAVCDLYRDRLHVRGLGKVPTFAQFFNRT